MLNRRLVLDYNDYRFKKQELYTKGRIRLGVSRAITYMAEMLSIPT